MRMERPRGAMTVDRRLLANVDRRLLSEMDHSDGVQLVKVLVSDAVWSTWRRYCDAVGVSMGRGLAFLLKHELAAVVGEDLDRLADMLEQREADVAAREAAVAEAERALAKREAEVAKQERRLLAAREPAPARPRPRKPPKLGRNDPCWCGSGKKFKVCHLGATG